MRIGAVFISDRGDRYLPACLESFDAQVPADLVDVRQTIDDSAHNLGMAGAVRAAWDWALAQDVDYLFHVEEDFVFLSSIPLTEMLSVLQIAPRLAQVVLRRQPWSDQECRDGGIVEMSPESYKDCFITRPRTLHLMLTGRDEQAETWHFLEHGRVGDCGFSLNPCLIPRGVLEMGWPDGNEAEFSQICVDRGLSFAFYGGRNDPPLVAHVGAVRGTGWRL